MCIRDSYKIVREAPDIENYDFRPQGFASILYDCDGRETERLVMAGSNREEAVYEEIPEDLINAFIAVEDNSFWNNKGIDIKGIIRGAKGVVTGDSSAGGGSTITQQLIKNTCLLYTSILFTNVREPERVLWSCAVFLKKQDLQAFVWRLQLYQRT